MKKRPAELDLTAFLRRYGRKKDRNHDSNDRDYSRAVEYLLRRIDPEKLDALMRGEGDQPGDVSPPLGDTA